MSRLARVCARFTKTHKQHFYLMPFFISAGQIKQNPLFMCSMVYNYIHFITVVIQLSKFLISIFSLTLLNNMKQKLSNTKCY